MAEQYKTEGITLKNTDFQDHDRIVTVFTELHGLIKLFARGGNNPKNSYNALTTPLICGEFIYTETRGELFRLHEGKVLFSNIHLRRTSSNLRTACQLIQMILQTQFPCRPSPMLYKLLSSCLNNIPEVVNSDTLTLSFLLKLQRHEGLFNTEPHCHICHQPMDTLSFYNGETYCSHHAPYPSLLFNENETLLFLQLAFARTFQQLNNLPPPSEAFRQKVLSLADELMMVKL